MATATASSYLGSPKYAHENGGVRLFGKYTTTLSAGDVVKLFKVQDGAIILDAGYKREGAGGDVTMRIRDRSDSASTTVSAGMELITATGSGIVSLKVGGGAQQAMLNYQVSLSAGVVNRYVDVELVCASASATGTHIYWVDLIFNK